MTITGAQESSSQHLASPAPSGRRLVPQLTRLAPLAMGLVFAAGAICWQWSLLKDFQSLIAQTRGPHTSAFAAGTGVCAKQVCCLTLAGVVALMLGAYGSGKLLRAQALQQERRSRDFQRDRLEQSLFEANSALSEASQAKARFVDSLSQSAHSHLNEIVSMADMVMDGPLTDRQVEWVQALRDSAESLVKIMNDSMDLSTIEVSSPELDSINFSLRCCLGDAIGALSQRAQAKGLEMESSIALNAPDALQGDPGRLRQIVGNLVGNAIKFSQGGRIALKVTSEPADAGAAQLHFVISDEGTGVSPQKRAALVKLLEEPTPVTLRLSGISGMGLLISARLAKMMNGRIWLDEESAGGCTFHFTASLKRQALGQWSAGDKHVSLSHLPVLVICSDSAQATRLTRTLQEWQMQPVLAETCQGAIDAIRKASAESRPLTLAILDAHVSGADGFDVAEKMRQEFGSNAPAVVMLASGGRRGDAQRCRKLGIGAYLTGPVKPSQLMTAIRMTAGTSPDDKRPLLTRHTLGEMERRLKVLLVDRQEAARREISALIEGWGHLVAAVCDAGEAGAAIDHESFDVVLMDSPTLQADPRAKGGAGAPALYAMVRRNDQADVQRCLSLGAEACLSRPLAPQALFDVLEKARSLKRSQAQAPAAREESVEGSNRAQASPVQH